MATHVMMRHPQHGLMRKGYCGFSWTYLFFGWFVPLFRGEIGIALMHLALTFFTFGIFQIIIAFLYNKQYMTRMIEKGYVLDDSEYVMEHARKKLGIVN